MAYDQRREHFADPDHPLQNTRYSDSEIGHCSICLLKLAGSGYGCYSCNIHLHGPCASYFQETISFFAHPSHTLKLSRSPGRICDICRGDCPQGSFVYRCIGCGFDVHPLCSMLPERVASPFGPKHEYLCMFFSESPGTCSACHHALPRWHYIGSSLKLHITCAGGNTPTGAGGLGSNGHAAIQSSYSYDYGAAVHGSQRSLFGTTPTAAGQMSSYVGPAAPAGYNYNYNPAGFQGYSHDGPTVSHYYYVPPPYGVTYYGPAIPSGGGGGGNGASGSGQQQSIFNNPSNLMGAIARFLVGAAINAVASDMLAQLLSSGLN